MSESIAWSAFVLGIVSAVSLPMGAMTTRLWRPGDRTTAMLMAFGGGALLAALTIDLVASALERGHFNTLALGALLGGVLFVVLNQVVNHYGGFLRKAATTYYHLRGEEHQRIRRIVSRIGQTDLFRELSKRDYKALAPSVRSLDTRRAAPSIAPAIRQTRCTSSHLARSRSSTRASPPSPSSESPPMGSSPSTPASPARR